MRKVIVLSFVLLFMGAGLANAMPDISSPTQLGSLLFFNYVDTRDGAETYIMLGNDANADVSLKCYWVRVGAQLTVPPECTANPALLPPTQSPADFTVDLTRNQPLMITASNGNTDLFGGVQEFGEGNQGYLVCFAVNQENEQIKWNFLFGSAVVARPGLSSPLTALQYPAWSYPVPKSCKNGDVIGTPGVLKLDANYYAGSPTYLTFTFPAVNSGIFDNIELKLVQGSQNFNTMSLDHHVTRLNLDLWNEDERFFSNIGVCAWCFLDTWLFNDVGEPSLISGNANFMLTNLHSAVGRLRIRPTVSQSCRPDNNLTAFQRDRCFGSATTFTAYQTGILGFGIQHYLGTDDVSLLLPSVSKVKIADTITYTP